MKRFLLAWLVVVLLPFEAFGQTPADSVLAKRLYDDAFAKEEAVRKALVQPDVSITVLRAVRTVVTDYETLVRRFPRSGYCDDALWHGGLLSFAAFKQFGDAQDRSSAMRLLRSLPSQYPTSRLAKQALTMAAAVEQEPPAHSQQPTALAAAGSRPVQVAEAASAVRPDQDAGLPPHAQTAPVAPVAPPTAPATATAQTTAPAPRAAEPPRQPPAKPGSPPRIATITAIRRTVLPDAVRITIELDSEVSFRDERLEGPLRVFVDLPSTRPSAELMDRTIRFETDADVVRQIRIGRHPDNMTRVVIDAADISAYSVYPLYNPDRLVIDCIRPNPAGVVATSPVKVHPPVAAVADPVVLGPVSPESIGRPLREEPPVVNTAISEPEPSPLDVAVKETSPAIPVAPPAANLQGGFSMARQLGLGVSRIVIDPGHGGQDPGALGQDLTEASLVLDIALRLERLLARVPGIEVILTRRTDVYLPLQARTAIANREGADLFLSIHANASSNKQTSGIETYFLNFASNQRAAAIAARENAASGQSMGALPDFVKTIALNNKVAESRDFATYVQRSMLERLKPANKPILDLGVKQAPFVVLIGAAMPSVLTEISFLSNAQDIKLLKTSAYRQRIADALFDATIKYQQSLKSADRVARRN